MVAWPLVALLVPTCLASQSASAGARTLGRVTFECEPEPAAGTFAPVFGSDPGANTASTNAGDDRLYVGGSGINHAFQGVLGLPQPNGFELLHRHALEQASSSAGRLVEVPDRVLLGELRLAASFARVPGGIGAADDRARLGRAVAGAVFLDVFAEGARPRSPLNVAMLYAVGPSGTGGDSRGDFLRAVEGLGGNAVLAVAEYNARSRTDCAKGGDCRPRVEVLVWCLVSGGIYRHPGASPDDVADATVRGMVAAGGGDGVGARPAVGDLPVVRFAHADGAFQRAVSRVPLAAAS